MLRKAKYRRWSDNYLVRISGVGFIVESANLQKILSIRVSLLFENLVGSVIWG